jgi:predicted ATP-grasp superfamily ATP-dependent carboligase
MDSPEMMGLSDKTTELQEEIKNIQDQISTITKDIEKEYE